MVTVPAYAPGLGLTDEHHVLADSVSAFAAHALDPAVARAAVDPERESKFPPFWPALVEHGLLGVHIAPDRGGGGGGLLELAVSIEAFSRTIAPGPFVPTALTSAILTTSNNTIADFLLPGLVDGTRTGAVHLGDPLSATSNGTDVRIAGTAHDVIGGYTADVVIAPVDLDGQFRLAALSGCDTVRQRRHSIDRLRPSADITADRHPVPVSRILDTVHYCRLHSLSAVVLGAEAVGLMSWCVAVAARHTATRIRSDGARGEFQSAARRCAHMTVALEKSRAALWDAARALDRHDDTADYAASIAATLVPSAAVAVTRDCVEIHGMLGLSSDHDARLYYRRALALRAALGTHADRAAVTASYALDGHRLTTTVTVPTDAEPLRDRIRRDLAPIHDRIGRARRAALVEGGWVAPHLPAPFGRGSSPLEQLVITEELAAAHIALPSHSVGLSAVSVLADHGTGRQQHTLITPTLRGDIVWCQLFDEPGAGIDPAALTTEARRVDGGWLVDGRKTWTVEAPFARRATLLARTSPRRAPTYDGLTLFALDMSSPGITVHPLQDTAGAALFDDIRLDDVFVPDDDVVGEVDKGWAVARAILVRERIGAPRTSDDHADGADLLDFVAGRNLSDSSRVAVGELVAESRAVDLLRERSVLQQLSGTDPTITAHVGAYATSILGGSIARCIVSEFGASRSADAADEPSAGVVDHFVATSAQTTLGASAEQQLVVIAERILGFPYGVDP